MNTLNHIHLQVISCNLMLSLPCTFADDALSNAGSRYTLNNSFIVVLAGHSWGPYDCFIEMFH